MTQIQKVKQTVESSKALVQRKVSDAEINRSASCILKRLKTGSQAAYNSKYSNVTEFHAILCKDGKIRLSRWHTSGIGLSCYNLGAKLFSLWDCSIPFRTKLARWSAKENVLTRKQIILKLKKARKMTKAASFGKEKMLIVQ